MRISHLAVALSVGLLAACGPHSRSVTDLDIGGSSTPSDDVLVHVYIDSGWISGVSQPPWLGVFRRDSFLSVATGDVKYMLGIKGQDGKKVYLSTGDNWVLVRNINNANAPAFRLEVGGDLYWQSAWTSFDAMKQISGVPWETKTYSFILQSPPPPSK